MSSLVDYKGLSVPQPSPTDRGGNAIKGDLQELADRAGPVLSVASDPTADDDSAGTAGNGRFYVWSKWFNTSSGNVFICVDDTPGAAVWKNVTSGGGGGGSPGGANTQVQFNDSGSFGGDAGFTYDKSTDRAAVGGLDVTDGGQTVLQSTLGDAVQTLSSTATADDPTETVVQNRVTTTNATATTLHTFTIPATTAVGVIAQVTARRTGGSAGTAEDGFFGTFVMKFKNVSGTASGGIFTSTYSADQGGWSVSASISGNTVLLQVTGATNNNITWHLTARVYQLSS